MSELITAEIFTDGQQNINAANMNGIIGNATVQPDVILNKPVSAAMDIADQFLVLKTDNTLAKSRFDTITNSVSSQLPLADTTKNGSLRQVSGKTTDVVDGTNNCVSIHTFLPAGVVVDYAGPNIPAGWLYAQGQSVLITDYPDLYAAIGTTYGQVDATHFTLPDYRGKLTPSVGGSFGALGVNGGHASITLTNNELPYHAHTLGNHTHLGANHAHSMQNHVHGADHYHLIPGGQFNHTHFDSGHNHSISGIAGGSNIAAGGGLGPSAISTGLGYAALSTYAQPQGQTNYASQTAGAWVNTGGPNYGSTDFADRGLTTGGPSTNTSDYSGSQAAFSILPPFQTVYKIIKV